MKAKGSKVFFSAMLLCAMLIFTQCIAMAKVYTGEQIVKNSEIIYIAGNSNFYPVEYYNSDTDRYEGAIPEMLERISDKIGVDFSYVHNGQKQSELAKNPDIKMVSSYIIDRDEEYIKDYVIAFSCIYGGKNLKIGWGFTASADEELVMAVRRGSAVITEQEINGYIISGSQKNFMNNKMLVIVITGFTLILAVFTLVLILIIRKIKRRIHINETTDRETGIGNLLYFENCFNKIIADGTNGLYYIAYIIIDSNYIQLYHGENIFRDAVKYTAEVLHSHMADNDFVARITENGFIFAYKSHRPEDAEKIIKDVMNNMNNYIDTVEASMKTYYYVALYGLMPNDKNIGLLLFNLRKNVNSIINTDKQLLICDKSMMNKDAEEKIFLDKILNGLKNKEFKLYLQFVFDNKTKGIVSAEALSRWESPEYGIVYPGKYIDKLEASGHISTLDYYMFEMCCRQLHKWKDTELDGLKISCNFTRITLSEIDFADKIAEIAKRYVFDNTKLVIEITEDAVEQNFDLAIKNIRKCKELGYKIALDDLGAGYTSLVNLCDYPIDIVKIDREILLKSDTQDGLGLFEGIIALAHSLDLKTVCEGVETEEHDTLVSKTKCDMIQGWYYSKVLPCREGEEFAKKKLQK